MACLPAAEGRLHLGWVTMVGIHGEVSTQRVPLAGSRRRAEAARAYRTVVQQPSSPHDTFIEVAVRETCKRMQEQLRKLYDVSMPCRGRHG